MTRPAITKRQLGLFLAGGSFLFTSTSAVLAEVPAAGAMPPAEVSAAAPPQGLARINIAPLRLELDAGKSAATVMLTNTSERPVPVQSRLFAWTQEAGEDRFAPSTALTISPSIISIPAGATQIVRVLRTGPASPGEKRFRLTVDQLPDPAMAQSGQAEARLRFALPVFFDRDTAGPAQLSWRLTGAKLELVNAGGQTVRVLALDLKTAAGQPVALQHNTLRYALGGSTIAWSLAGGCALGPVTLSASVDGQTVNAQVSPTCG